MLNQWYLVYFGERDGVFKSWYDVYNSLYTLEAYAVFSTKEEAIEAFKNSWVGIRKGRVDVYLSSLKEGEQLNEDDVPPPPLPPKK